MKWFAGYLSEAFPFQKKEAGPKKPNPFGSAPDEDGEDVSVDEGQPQEPGGVNPEDKEQLDIMQQAQAEREEQEAQLTAKKAAEEEAERQRVKKLRAMADNEVADALVDKFNDDYDEVEFYPDMTSFGLEREEDEEEERSDGYKRGNLDQNDEDEREELEDEDEDEERPGEESDDEDEDAGEEGEEASEDEESEDDEDGDEPDSDEDGSEDDESGDGEPDDDSEDDASEEDEEDEPDEKNSKKLKKVAEAVINFQKSLL